MAVYDSFVELASKLAAMPRQIVPGHVPSVAASYTAFQRLLLFFFLLQAVVLCFYLKCAFAVLCRCYQFWSELDYVCDPPSSHNIRLTYTKRLLSQNLSEAIQKPQ